MKRHLLILSLLIAFAGSTQQVSFLGFYRDIGSFYNPAMSGFEHSFSANLLYRDQWTGYSGAPRTYTGQVGAKLSSINSGIGLNVMRYEIGFSKSTSITANYNYQWALNNDNSQLSIGVAPKFYHLQFSKIYSDSADAVSNLPSWNRSGAFTANLGAAFQNEKFFVGLSAMNLIPTEKQLGDDFNFNHTVHLSLMTSYSFNITDRMKLIPHIHLQTDFVMLQPFVNLKAEHEKLWYQIGYRRNVLSSAIGYRFIGMINVGYMLHYSPDAPVYPHLWSHEAIITYELK